MGLIHRVLKYRTHLYYFLLGGGFLYSFLILALNVDKGFDLMDGGYYILCAQSPGDISAAVRMFGFYTGILYKLVSGNIALFRLSGIVMLLCAAWIFSGAMNKYWSCITKRAIESEQVWTTRAVVLSTTLTYYHFWLVTPSYNWLALIGVFLVAASLMNASSFVLKSSSSKDRNNRWSGESELYMYAVLLGASGVLAFMAKPTTAAALAFLSILWVSITPLRNRWATFLPISISTAMLLMLFHSYILADGPLSFVTKLANGVDIIHSLGTYNTEKIVLRDTQDIMALPITAWESLISTKVLAVLSLLLVTVFISHFKWFWCQKREIVPLAFVLVVLVTWLELQAKNYWNGGSRVWILGFGGCYFMLTTFFCTLLVYLKKGVFSSSKRYLLPIIFLSVFLFLLSFSYAFGTNNGLIRQMSGAFVFLAAGSLLLAYWIDLLTGKNFVSHIMAICLIVSTGLVLHAAFQKPYLLTGKISDQNRQVHFYQNRGSLLVDQPSAEYIENLIKIAKGGGWVAGSPLINFTGVSPGTTVILGGQAPGIPWLVGGLPGSEKVILRVLSTVPKNILKKAWVLTTSNGKRAVPTDILVKLGCDFPGSYKKLGTVKSSYRKEDHILWRPDKV